MNRLINEAEYFVEPERAVAEIPTAVRMLLLCTAGSMDQEVMGAHEGVPSRCNRDNGHRRDGASTPQAP